MRLLQFALLCCMAMILVIGCASEKMEQAPETSQQPSKADDATATATAAATAEEPSMAAAKEITLAVTGMT